MSVDASYHQTRFAYDERRETLWRSLYRFFFEQWIRKDDCVLELGAGYGHFINNVMARRRIALDTWSEMPKYLQPGIECQIGNVTDLSFVEDGSVDFAFASNLFEHITQDDLAQVLSQLQRKLSARGLLCLVQPNYRYAYREYFDDYTHVTVYSHLTMCDFLRANGYEIVDCKPRFMPLTVKSRLKISSSLIWLYLRSPVKPMGKQMLIVARPSRTSGSTGSF
ncbi:MAG: class I SAM-dependent methyltransferase [Candidatus Korobacteraceae bacterium]